MFPDWRYLIFNNLDYGGLGVHKPRLILSVDSLELSGLEQTLLHSTLEVLQSMEAQELGPLFSVLNLWHKATAETKAIVLKSLNPRLKLNEIAKITGVSERTLRRYRSFQYLRRLLRATDAPEVPHGSKPTEGEIEAWLS